jgi:hypothetical protein
MASEFVEWGSWAAAVYLAVGVVFAVPFVARWVGRLDPDAAPGTCGFRVLIVPGVVALWPLLGSRLASGRRPRERNAHRDAAEQRA